MLRLTKHYSEGIQSSIGRTSRNLTEGSILGFRIIYIISLFTVRTKNHYRQIKLYCQNSLLCAVLGDIIGGLSLFALLFLALIFGGVLL
jgi:hypothetical protein